MVQAEKMFGKKMNGEEVLVRNIYCIGRNYVEHAKELNHGDELQDRAIDLMHSAEGEEYDVAY